MGSELVVPAWTGPRRAIVSSIAMMAVLIGLSPAVTGAAAGSSIERGAATIVDPVRQTSKLTHGQAQTPFSVRLPDKAACPGDSANDQWRIQTFMLPATSDPGAVSYGPIGPDPTGNGRYALFAVDTTPFVHQLTVRNPAAGDPGIIPVLPSFDFTVVQGERIPAGRYQIGVACTFFGATKKVWVVEVLLTVSDGELSWRLPGLPESINQHRESSGLPTIVVLSCIGVAAASLLVWRRRTSKPVANLSKEPT